MQATFPSRYISAFLCRTLVAALLLSFAREARAQPVSDRQDEKIERAKEHYERGSRFYGQGRYKDAVRELMAAYGLSRETILLYNIAKSWEKLGEFEKAIQSLQDYLDLSPSLSASDRSEVERGIQDLLRRKQEMMPELVIRSNPRGASIFIDTRTKLLGQTPDKFRIEPGPHRVCLEKKGFEPIEKDFVMPSGKPLILDFELSPAEEYGNIQIIANLSGARVFVNGKNVGITPYREMPSVKIGFHQVILEKDGYFRWEKRVEVHKGRTTLVLADLVPMEEPSSAPAVLGWTSLVLGGLCLGGAAVAYHFAQEQFNDTENFKTLHNLELGGYVSGGVLVTLAATLIVYDLVRDDPTERVRKPASLGFAPSSTLGLGLDLSSKDPSAFIHAGFSF